MITQTIVIVLAFLTILAMTVVTTAALVVMIIVDSLPDIKRFFNFIARKLK